ncbi:MAG: ANTAR domain-containing protein [Clostridia bacterium]|nr:ANTAR domain-containing protein [Clostridia bacterium]
MFLKQTVYSVMIISSSTSFIKSFKALLSPAEFSPVVEVHGVNEARRMLNQRSFDFVVIDSALDMQTGVRFASRLSSSSNTIVVLFSCAEVFNETYESVTASGVFCVLKPFSTQSALTALLWMVAARERIRQYEQKEMTLEEKMQAIRLINRAKLLLMEHEKLTEEQAHKRLEKQAMDACVPKTEIAARVIEKYANEEQ